ncbi:hypothetical protein LX12_000571 [Williamsia serinedens]|uniref:Uncharacterized protein n=1 Tax=Williamsia serinedens TaxID=391736 RepID=A0ABT1GWP1_9NOCA|nr:hypothetical protein [Williamsia serinedens]
MFETFLSVRLTLRTLVGILVVTGVTVGVLGAVGWRYATRRLVVIADPPPTPPGSTGLVFTGPLNVVAGPQWWPGLLLLPATGIVVATAVGTLVWALLTLRSGPWATWLTLASAATATGICVAIATLWLTDERRPAVLVRTEEGSDAGATTTPLTEGLWDREWAPIGLWFPVVGILVALVITAALYGIHLLAQRTSRPRFEPRDNT